MISKNKMMIVLAALGATHAALSTGCMVPVEVGSSSTRLSMEADVYDVHGNPLDYPFDYYLDLYMLNGDHLIYHKDQQHTDLSGVWTDSEINLQVYYDNGGLKCYDSCVSYDAYGCTAYAQDCWDPSYTATLETDQIQSTTATIGIDTGTDYIAYAPSDTYSSFTYGSSTFRQYDRFDTDILVVYGASARTQSIGSAGGSAPSVTRGTNPKAKAMARGHKPTRISFANRAQLTDAQKAQLNVARRALHLPAAN